MFSDEGADVVGPCERVDEVFGPSPVGGEVDAGVLAAGAADDSRGVEQAVAESFGLGDLEFTVESEPLGPGDKVLSAQHGGEPCLVDRERCRGKDRRGRGPLRQRWLVRRGPVQGPQPPPPQAPDTYTFAPAFQLPA